MIRLLPHFYPSQDPLQALGCTLEERVGHCSVSTLLAVAQLIARADGAKADAAAEAMRAAAARAVIDHALATPD